MNPPPRPPNTQAPQRIGAALVLHHTQAIELDPMFRALCADSPRGIASVELRPVAVVDFYPKVRQ